MIGRLKSFFPFIKVRPRVLFIGMTYPQLSQTYIKSEIRTLSTDYEIKIVATSVPNFRDPEHLPFERIDDFESLVKVARLFKPDIIHGHYLIQGRTLSALAARIETPFTIRAHSFDCIFKEDQKPPHLVKLAEEIDFDLCLGILAFPFVRPVLESFGIPPAMIVDVPPVIDFQHFYRRSENKAGIMNVGACIPKKRMEDFIELAVRLPMKRFDLYPIGHQTAKVKQLNESCGSPVKIHDPIPFSRMPAEYKKHDWLVYTACPDLKTVGWPMAIAEAQASGVVPCMAYIREDLKDYIGDSGYLYNSISEVKEIVEFPPPNCIREAGFDRARGFDINSNIHLLTDRWRASF